MTRRLLVSGLSLIGLIGAMSLATGSSEQHSLSCAALGRLSVCHFAMVGYASMFVSALLIGRASMLLFSTGWLVATSVSVSASLSDLALGPGCPRVLVLIPACFVSVGLVLAAGYVWAGPWISLRIGSRR